MTLQPLLTCYGMLMSKCYLPVCHGALMMMSPIRVLVMLWSTVMQALPSMVLNCCSHLTVTELLRVRSSPVAVATVFCINTHAICTSYKLYNTCVFCIQEIVPVKIITVHLIKCNNSMSCLELWRLLMLVQAFCITEVTNGITIYPNSSRDTR